MSMKLTYFPMRGRCHQLRYLLADNEIKCELPKISMDQFAKDIKPKMV